jgi:O-antigen/teichoic acid export membrane protein
MLHRVLQSLRASAFSQASQILIQFVSVPILIHAWGLVYYGEWLLLFTIPSYLGLSDAGLTSAISNELLINVSKKEYPKAARLLGNGMTSIIGFGVLASAFLAAALELSDFTTWLKINQIQVLEARFIILFLMIYVMLILQQELMSTVPRAEGDNATGRIWTTITRLLEFALVVLLVSLGYKALAVALGYLVVRGLSWGAMFFYYRRRFEWVSLVKVGLFPLAEIRHLLSPSMAFLGFALANSMILQGSTLLIGFFMTPVHVVIYTALRTLSNFIRQIMNLLTSAIWPELTRALIANDFPRAVILHRRVCQIAFWTSLVLLFILETTGGPILSVWTKGAVEPLQPVFTLLLLATLPYSLWLTSATIAISVNRHQNIALNFVLSSLCTLVATTWLIPRYGLSGMAIGLLIGDCFMLFPVFRNSLRILLEERIGKLVPAILTDFGWLQKLQKQQGR